LAVGDKGEFKDAADGLLVSCNHSGVVEKRVRLVAGGSFCCVGIVISGCAWMLPGRWRSSSRSEFGIFWIEIIQVEVFGV
jgi:hypothetical protein